MATLTRLFIHPVKSMRGIGLTHALADVSGLAFDRIFMITEPDGTFITARQFPQMVRFTPSPVHDGLHLTAPDGSSAYVRFADFATQDAPTEVWGTHFTARIAPDAINKWLSGFFSREVQLRWVGPQMTRRVKRHNTVPLSFADGYPYLLANADKDAPGWPHRESPPQASSAFVEKLRETDQEIRDTIGLHKASLGMQSNERSGAAIRERKKEGDVGTFAFIDNLIK